MRRSALLLLIILAGGLLPPTSRPGAAEGTPAEAVLSGAIPPALDDEEMDAPDEAGPDVRVVAAAPRAAIAGRGGFVLPLARPGRAVNVVEGETVRFVSGVHEAVWYAGAGAVESLLTIVGRDPSGSPQSLGRDRLLLRGTAPAIDRGRARVDVAFPAAGTFPVAAVVSVTATPRNGRGQSRTERVPYVVRVWGAGELGGVTGSVRDEADGSPLAGIRVVAVEASSRSLAATGYTRCDGAYHLRRLPPGDYLIAARGRRGFTGEFYDDAPDAAAATPVAVAPGADTAGIDFLLSRP